MAYQRKTADYWEIQGNYGQGWECVTADPSRKIARANLSEHMENEPGVPFRMVKKRERIDEGAASVPA